MTRKMMEIVCRITAQLRHFHGESLDVRRARICQRMIGSQLRIAFERIRWGIARRAGFDVDLLNSAAEVDELYPAETIAGPPCVVLPGQYERVRACAFGANVAKEI